MKQHRRKALAGRISTALLLTAACFLLAACASKSVSTMKEADGSADPAQGGEQDKIYTVTEENDNEDLVMNDQPEAPYWFPEQLLEWSKEKDPDFEYNVSRTPLAERVDKEKLTPVNKTQNKDTKTLAISIMNGSTSGNPPRGLNKFKCNTFGYWQYVDMLVYWGGSSGEGLIVAPSPDVTDMGHKNGVEILGTCFFPQSAHGGKLEWLDVFLQKAEDGGFPMTDKLIEAAKAYGFDGWFLNQESEGEEGEPLTKEHADLMREFIAEFKKKAPELKLVYYDSMTVDGEMDWQNALTEKNAAYMKDEQGNPVSDAMFLNFWWTEEELADQELLKASALLAAETGIDPYELYAGMDIQSDGYMTQERWDLFENPDGGTWTSLGLYCPNWAWSTAADPDDFAAKENVIWVNSKKDPSAEAEYSSPTQWRGVSAYVVERSPLTSLPFVTNFSVGNGYSFFIKGERVSSLDWNNRSISDVLPTYRWIMENEGKNALTPSYSMAEAYYGGNSLKFHGTVDAKASTLIKLYSADLPVLDGVTFTTTAMAAVPTQLDLVLLTDDGSELTIPGDTALGDTWTTVNYDMKDAVGKSIRSISYRITPEEASGSYDLYLGNITVGDMAGETAPAVSGLKVEKTEFDEDSMYAGVRLTWSSESPAAYYEVFRRNQDGAKSLLGVTNTENFYVNTLPRTDETNLSTFEVVPVNRKLEEGEAVSASMEWPDNSLPKADFTADRTLTAPGETIVFESRASQNTKDVEWIFEGGEPANSTEENPSVVYKEAGVYKVSMKASNESGKDEAAKEGYILVRDDAAGPLKLLSQEAPAEATAYTNENESPKMAVDGDVTKKWCATGTPPHEITIDLGGVKTISEVDVSHAEAGGESPDMNTKAYTISVSADGSAFTDVVSVTRNTGGTSKDTFAPAEARYVKLSVVKPTQGSDTAARIYEVEIYGIDAE